MDSMISYSKDFMVCIFFFLSHRFFVVVVFVAIIFHFSVYCRNLWFQIDCCCCCCCWFFTLVFFFVALVNRAKRSLFIVVSIVRPLLLKHFSNDYERGAQNSGTTGHYEFRIPFIVLVDFWPAAHKTKKKKCFQSEYFTQE